MRVSLFSFTFHTHTLPYYLGNATPICSTIRSGGTARSTDASIILVWRAGMPGHVPGAYLKRVSRRGGVNAALPNFPPLLQHLKYYYCWGPGGKFHDDPVPEHG